MSATTLAPIAAPTASPAPPALPAAPPWRLLVLGCLALATLSLLAPSVPTYDPWAWIIWGREIANGELSTVAGPSWKPFPVLFTAPFSLLGDTAAPLAWLVVARAGALLALAMAYRLAAGVAGRAAGVVAVGALALSDGFLFNAARGNSEGILVAVSLWAIERHLAGRRLDAFLLGVAAALLRPEVWPVLAVYGLYLWLREPVPRSRGIVAAGGAAVLALWLIPEYVGSGNFLRAASRARAPGFEQLSDVSWPSLEVLERSSDLLTAPVYVGAALAVVVAVRRRDRLVLSLAAVAVLLMATVAAMTEGGFAGNLRYVALPAAVVAVLAGIGWVEAARWAGRRAGPAAAATVVAAGVVLAWAPVRADLHDLRADALAVREEAALDGSVAEAVEAAGGRDAVLACGDVVTGAYQTQTVAWHLGLREHEVAVDTSPTPPATVIAPRFTAMWRTPDFRPIGRTEHWVVSTSCP
jgi:hypothetical protein